MRFSWPEDTKFTRLNLDVEDRSCPVCQRRMAICDHRRHPIFTLNGPTEIICKLVHCPDAGCASRPKTFSPLAETAITLPYWLIGWDVFCWIGLRRFTHHWSIPQLRAELIDSYEIPLSHDALGLYIQRYQTMLAARQQDAQILAKEYQSVDSLILSIDGLQPEKGHETLYVVRELTLKRVWFGEALISSSAAEVQRLFIKARQWAEQLGKPVQLWVSDKQDAFLTGIAAEFPGVPLRYCSNHFVRDLAKPILEADSNAKVKMRSKVRGLRNIEREVLGQQSQLPVQVVEIPSTAAPVAEVPPVAMTVVSSVQPMDAASQAALDPTVVSSAQPMDAASQVTLDPTVVSSVQPMDAASQVTLDPTVVSSVQPMDAASQVVLDYCSAVRGVLNSDQGGPLQPPGLRMAGALQEIRESLQVNLEEKKGYLLMANSNGWPTASTKACPLSRKPSNSFANKLLTWPKSTRLSILSMALPQSAKHVLKPYATSSKPATIRSGST